MAKYLAGKIVWAIVPDNRGKIKEAPRPNMVLRDTVVISPDDLIRVVVGSHSAAKNDPLEEQCVLLDYKKLRLPKPTVLVCDWVADIRHGDITEVGNLIYGPRLKEVVDAVEKYNGSV